MKENKHIIREAKGKVTFKNNFTVNKWKRFYDMLSDSQKNAVFAKLELLQSQFITDSMAELEKEIKLTKIGKLIIKPNRLKFYELREKYPDKPVQEIRRIIIDEHIETKRSEYKNKSNINTRKKVKELHFNK